MRLGIHARGGNRDRAARSSPLHGRAVIVNAAHSVHPSEDLPATIGRAGGGGQLVRAKCVHGQYRIGGLPVVLGWPAHRRGEWKRVQRGQGPTDGCGLVSRDGHQPLPGTDVASGAGRRRLPVDPRDEWPGPDRGASSVRDPRTRRAGRTQGGSHRRLGLREMGGRSLGHGQPGPARDGRSEASRGVVFDCAFASERLPATGQGPPRVDAASGAAGERHARAGRLAGLECGGEPLRCRPGQRPALLPLAAAAAGTVWKDEHRTTRSAWSAPVHRRSSSRHSGESGAEAYALRTLRDLERRPRASSSWIPKRSSFWVRCLVPGYCREAWNSDQLPEEEP
jgi:hypothetical protein